MTYQLSTPAIVTIIPTIAAGSKNLYPLIGTIRKPMRRQFWCSFSRSVAVEFGTDRFFLLRGTFFCNDMKPTAHIWRLKLFWHVPNITLVGGNRRNFFSSTRNRVVDHDVKTENFTCCLTFQVSHRTRRSHHLLSKSNQFSFISYSDWTFSRST